MQKQIYLVKADKKNPQYISKLDQQSSFKPTRYWSNLEYNRGWNEHKYQTVLIKENETVIGLFTYAPVNLLLYIARFGILPEFRMKGYGKKGLDLFEAQSKEKGVTAIYLDVDKTNTVGIDFWESCGYENWGEREPSEYFPADDGIWICYMKEL